MSTAFHPQTDGQSERTIQVLEDMLRACALDMPDSWKEHLHLVEFSYNNSYHDSIGMAPFEALYGRRCRTPLCWFEVGEGKMFGPEIVQRTTEKIKLIQNRLRSAQDRQRKYAGVRRRPLEFHIGEKVFLKVSPTKGVSRFGLKGKLSPRYIGPFEILKKVGEVAYKLALPPNLSRIHKVFHVSQLRKYFPDETHVIKIDPLELQEDLSLEEEPEMIIANSKGMFEEMLDSISQLSTDSEATPPPRLLYAYDTAIFGFAAKLSPMHLESIRNMDAFVAAIPDRSMRRHTTHSYQFLGLEQGKGLWHASNLESDVIIGIIDDGIWPEHPSFQDHGFGPVPARWKGTCDSGTNFSLLNCNRKLIGARYFFKGYEAAYGKVNEVADFKSPRATDGHGTHCASTAGGNLVQNASFYGLARGVAAGMRYTSRIAVYKVCWEGPTGCITSDIFAAIEQVINDGVDVVSMSLGRSAMPYFEDPIAQPAFTGIKRGIFFSLSAGNDGPRTVGNTAPWLMTVAASYTDRSFPTIVKLGNGQNFEGISLYSGKSLKELPIVYGPTAGKKSAQYCAPGTLSPKLVKGKVVVCEQIGGFDTYQQAVYVKSAGGAGIIFPSLGEIPAAYTSMFPAASVGYVARKAILSYLKSTKSPTASLTFKGTAYGKRAPMMAAFSSRGPNPVSPDLLKPDLTAPGVNILAAWPSITNPSGEEGDKRRVLFNLMSGTSMACPHVSGLAALLISRHKEWSPAAVKSAMMTTAYNLDNGGSPIKDAYHGGPATPFAIGSGHVDIQKASDPGLLYDIHPHEYLHYLCSLNYSSSQIALFDRNFTCPKRTTMQPGDLNYPSFAVPFKSDDVTITYRRTVTNVGNPPIGTYKVHVEEPIGISVRVKPNILSFKMYGQKLQYKVSFTIKRRFIESDDSSFGSLIWVSEKYMVRSPIVITYI